MIAEIENVSRSDYDGWSVILDTINDFLFEDSQNSFKNEERKRSVFNERMKVFKRITKKEAVANPC